MNFPVLFLWTYCLAFIGTACSFTSQFEPQVNNVDRLKVLPGSINRPAPPLRTFTVWNNHTRAPCLRVRMRAAFQILYDLKSGGNASATVAIGDKANSSGFCGSHSQSLRIDFFAVGWRAELNFSRSGSVYSLSSLRLRYNVSNSSVFPGASDARSALNETGFATYVSVWRKNYLNCSSLNITLGKRVTLVTKQLTLQAFRTDNSGVTFVGTGEKCLSDWEIFNFLPVLIAVGIFLFAFSVFIAALVIYRMNRGRNEYGRL